MACELSFSLCNHVRSIGLDTHYSKICINC